MSEQQLSSRITDEDVAAFSASGEFDEQWYVNEYPDVLKSGIGPARHYLWLGRRLGRKPSNPASSPAAPAADGEGAPHVDATSHEGHPPASPSAKVCPSARLIDSARSLFSPRRNAKGDSTYDLVAAHFDEDFYLTTYPDVEAAAVDPVQHYLDAGWRENRDPSLSFSTRFYVENNADVVAAGVNPFYHYIAAGKAEGRLGKHQLGFRWDILSRLKPVAEQVREIKSHRPASSRSQPDRLTAALEGAMAGARNLVVSFSHDDFNRNVGGVQLLMQRESKLLRDSGYLHLHVFPEHPLSFLDTSGEDISLGVLINNRAVGFFRAQDLVASFGATASTRLKKTFIVHSLLGHNMDQTIDILHSIGMREGLLWLHDYSPIYNNFKLLRNDVEYSGFPSPGSIARELCEFARADFCHAAEFRKLLGAFQVKLVSPSQAAMDVWDDAGVLHPFSSHVVEHVRLVPRAVRQPDGTACKGPLKVAFLGYPAVHKGWPVFQELILRFRDDPRYEFHHLGKGRIGGLPVRYREVLASETKMDAMREAVEEMGIDLALLWSIWPETFCLTAYEALAGGAYLISNSNAGNIIKAIEQTGEGRVLPDERALHDAFESGDVLRHARGLRPVSHFTMNYSSLSLELLD